MARLSDVPVVLRTVGVLPFLKRIVREVLEDNLFTLAGGLAYSWLFAVFPFLVFLMNVFPLFAVGREQETKEGMQVFLKAALPDPAAKMLWDHMEQRIGVIIQNPSPWIAALSLLFALWAASKGIGVTMAAMEKCYELEKGRAFYTRRAMGFGLTLMVSGLVFALVLLLPAGAAFKSWTAGQGEQLSFWSIWIFDVVRGALATGVVLLILALFYHFGPGVRHRWHFLTPGSVFVLLTWVGVGLAFRYYVNNFGKSSYEATYGSVGAVAILLLLFYIDAVVLLIGSQINSEIDFEVLKVPRGTRNFRIAERRHDAPALPPAGAGAGKTPVPAPAGEAGSGAGSGASPGAPSQAVGEVAAAHGAD
jgi:membrane protein